MSRFWHSVSVERPTSLCRWHGGPAEYPNIPHRHIFRMRRENQTGGCYPSSHFNEMAQNQDVFFINSINTMDFTQFPHFLGEPQRNCRIPQQGPNKVSSVGSGANCQLPVPCPKHFQHGCGCWKERGNKNMADENWSARQRIFVQDFWCIILGDENRQRMRKGSWWRRWVLGKALFMESMVRWSWMSRLPRSDSFWCGWFTDFPPLRLTEVGSSVQSMAS